MLRNVITGLTGLAATALLSSCADDQRDVSSFASHALYRERIAELGLAQTAAGRQWLAEAQLALDKPAELAIPHQESGAWLAHEPRAIGISLNAIANEVLFVQLEQMPLDEFDRDAAIYVDLFHVGGEPSRPEFTAIGPLLAEANTLHAKLPKNGNYILRLQPELLASLSYRITIELDAALPFPIDGLEISAVQSVFGDPRDAGARVHEGIDIFAPRDTPVIAVSDGRASARTNRLGGNVVWLTTADTSYYYAHLERAEFAGSKRAVAGDVLGYVGNSGNAKTTAPHLHFGVYGGRRRPVDPLPLLRSRRFTDHAPEVQSFLPHYVQISASSLNLRDAPSMRGAIVSQLERDMLVRGLGVSGAWLQVETLNGGRGWVHTEYVTRVDQPIAQWQVDTDTWLMDSPLLAATPIALVPAETLLETLAVTDAGRLVRRPDGDVAGWLRDKHGLTAAP